MRPLAQIRLRRSSTRFMKKNSFWVYVLKSGKDESFYIGSTQNLEDRFKAHNDGRNQYTKSYRPWKIVYKEAFISRSESVQRERFLKSGAGRKFLNSFL